MSFRLLAVVAAGIGLVITTSARGGCAGDYYVESNITPEHHVTTVDLDDFANGKLGVVPNTYWRVYQFLAYRVLSGRPIPRKDISALGVSGWQLDIMRSRDEDMGGVDIWNQARTSISGAKPVTVESEVRTDDYVYFTNCMSDAFRQAAATLNDRLKRGGQRWAASWLSRQDTVFANCGAAKTKSNNSPPNMFPREPVLPGPLELDAPPWLAHDRDYQIAAALFYAGRYDKARDAFLAISRNTQSSWQPMAAYLAARCLVRKANLIPSHDPELNKQQTQTHITLEQARNEMHAAEQSFPAARGLANWLDARVQPQRRVNELATALAAAKSKDGLGRMLADYLLLMNNVGRQEMIVSPQGLTAWIGTMQATHEDGPYSGIDAKALEDQRRLALKTARKWYAGKHEELWLLPILTNARPGELVKSEMEAASAVSANAPAYQTLQYHLARLALEEGRADEADEIATSALKGSDMSIATRNRWLGLKLLSGKNLNEFLQAAPRGVAEPHRDEAMLAKPLGDKAVNTVYEEDIAQHVFRDFPLADLKLLRLRADFPEIWKKTLDEVIWTRAVIFEDYATADELAEELAKGRNSTRHLYERFKAATTLEAKRLAAMIILVNTPELHPAVGSHLLPSWGCRDTEDSKRSNELQRVVPNAIGTESRDRAQMEWKQLAALPIRTRYLAPALLAWAKEKPADPEAPKSLHLLVASTRMECPYGDSDKGKSNHSREAFQLLHKLYPKSSWAAKTRYYF